MDATEAAFRAKLLTQALACDWAAWDATRLQFADWLEDEGRLEMYLARSPWFAIRKVMKRRPMGGTWYVYMFGVMRPTYEHRVLYSMKNHYNTEHILGFVPPSLKLHGIGPKAFTFTWVPNRKGERASMDTDLRPDGFLSMWKPVGQTLLPFKE